MNKRYLHHLWARLRPVKTWYLFVAFLTAATVCLIALRSNYANMITLRDQVYAADKSGQGVEPALQRLRSYVGSHINTNLYSGKGVYPPVQLKYTYDRLVKAEQDRVNAANANVYTNAQKYCESVDPNSFYGRERVPCIQQYVKSRSTVTAQTIPDALYKFDFVSPRWSPDLAGWTLVLSVALLGLTVIRLLLGRVLRLLVK